MSQPKLPLDLRQRLNQLGLEASCYQPVTKFIKNGRKRPNVAEPGDPWHCFLRLQDDPWVQASADGDTLRAAVEEAIRVHTNPGVLGATSRLSREMESLTKFIRARYAC